VGIILLCRIDLIRSSYPKLQPNRWGQSWFSIFIWL